VLLLHGLAGHALEWVSLASRLVESCRVVAFDQRGHGGSTTYPAELSREAFVEDVVAVIEQLRLGPVALVGQSMGAHTALLAAATRPDLVSRLALIEGGVGGEGPGASEGVITWLEKWPVPFADEAAAAEFFGGGLLGQGWAAGLTATPEGLVPRFDVQVMREAILAVHSDDRWREWSSIRQPVLLVKADSGYLRQDEADRMLGANPHARLITIDGAGHDVQLEAPDRLAAALLGFLDE
jgi:pimeloyl-ACP methyl ester carboxylesterase